jgi:hypothetical protein
MVLGNSPQRVAPIALTALATSASTTAKRQWTKGPRAIWRRGRGWKRNGPCYLVKETYRLNFKGVTWVFPRANKSFPMVRLFGAALGLLERAIMQAFIREVKWPAARCVWIVECLLLLSSEGLRANEGPRIRRLGHGSPPPPLSIVARRVAAAKLLLKEATLALLTCGRVAGKTEEGLPVPLPAKLCGAVCGNL